MRIVARGARICAALFVVLIVGMLSVTIARADATPAAVDITFLSNSRKMLGAPSIRVGLDGLIHVAWLEGPGPWRIRYAAYSRSTDGKGTITQIGSTQDVSVNSSGASATMATVSLAVDKQGRSHIVWNERPNATGQRNNTIYYSRIEADNKTISVAKVRVARATDIKDIYSTDPAINIYVNPSDDSKIHLVWAGGNGAVDPPSGTAHDWAVYYTESSDGGENWQNFFALSTPSGRYAHGEQPALAIEANDNVHVIWRNAQYPATTVYVEARHRINGTWTAIERLKDGDKDESYGWYPSIGVDGSGKVYAAYRSTNSVGHANNNKCCWVIRFVTWQNGSGWSQPSTVLESNTDGDPKLFDDFPNLTVTQNGLLFLLFSVNNGHGTVFTQSVNGGASWQSPIFVDGGLSRWPRCALYTDSVTTQTGMYIVWQGQNGSGHDVAFTDFYPPALAIRPEPRMAVTAAVNNGHSPNSAKAGDTITYTIDITNVGRLDEYNAVLNAKLSQTAPGNWLGTPSAVTQVATDGRGSSFQTLGTPTSNGSATPIAQNGVIVKRVNPNDPASAPGSVELSFSVPIVADPPSGTAIISATFTLTGTFPPTWPVSRPARDVKFAASPVTLTRENPAMTYSRSVSLLGYADKPSTPIAADTTVLPGDVLVVSMVATNTGKTTLGNVTFNDSLPSGVVVIPGTVTTKGGTGFTVTATGASPLASGGSLQPDEKVMVSYRALVTTAAPAAFALTGTGGSTETGQMSAPTLHLVTLTDNTSLVAPPTEGSTALAMSLSADPDGYIKVPASPAPVLSLTLRLHNYGSTATPDKMPLSFDLSRYLVYDPANVGITATGVTAGKPTIAPSRKIIVPVSAIAAGADATLTLTLSLQNGSAYRRLQADSRVTALIASKPASNTAIVTLGSAILSTGLSGLNGKDVVGLPPVARFRVNPTTPKAGSHAATTFAGKYLNPHEPVALYIVAPGGAVTPAGTALANGAGFFSHKVSLAGLSAGTYRVVGIGGWSHQTLLTTIIVS